MTAACASHPDPDMWFREDSASVTAAKAVCAVCPARAACEALGADEPFGTFGGVSAAERFSLMLDGMPQPAPHIPSRGHYVEGCRDPQCCAANTAWTHEWRHRDRPTVTAGGTVDATEQLSLDLEASA